MSHAAQGLYDPAFEHDACGLGFVAHIKGARSHGIVTRALDLLENLSHRGAVGCDPCTGDGSGVLIQLPHYFLSRAFARLREPGTYGIGMVFLPTDAAARLAAITAIEQVATEEGLRTLGWRDVPVDPSALGEQARRTQPVVRQIALAADLLEGRALERRLYIVRRRIERAHMAGVYVPSLSSRTIIYKGLLRPDQLPGFYPDLRDPDLATGLALVHSRFSTNTFPTWPLAHPYRFICHNGEINTLRGNVVWTRVREELARSPLFGDDIAHLFPLVAPGQSDSACFDNVLEFLVAGGVPLAQAVMMMIPEAWDGDAAMDPDRKAFYEYQAGVMEPWDGPAAMAFTDGVRVGATLDRNGLRPLRYAVTHDDLVIAASEAGALPLRPDEVRTKGRLAPGRMLLVDTGKGRIVDDEELKAEVASRHPYREWVDAGRTTLADLPAALAEPIDDLAALHRLFGYTGEDKRVLLAPMAATGEEAVGSMGNDTPLAVLAEKPPLLFKYFKQLFAQVTNPAIDPIREQLVMSVAVTLGRRRNVLDDASGPTPSVRLARPVLDNDELARLRWSATPVTVQLPMLWRTADGAAGLASAVDGLCATAEAAVNDGASILILSDRGASEALAPIPSLLATAAAHHHLLRARVRGEASLVVETGEAREVAHVAALIGYGAAAVNPYVALATVSDGAKYLAALSKGLLKILSKMGISTVQSYCGAQVFEAVGIARDVIDRYFTGTPSRLGGIGLAEIAAEVVARWDEAGDGEYAYRANGEHHAWNPRTIATLQRAARTNDEVTYAEFAAAANADASAHTLRGLLELVEVDAPVPLEEVEPAASIVRRFSTGAMSFGSLGREAHEALAIAMNQLGGRSNTGEGGEDRGRFGTNRSSAIKQVASGRFGVTTEYLVNARELQIKIAQGAKPGEGGQLPGHKVDETIAEIRFATPGVTLISPPPHHDIYSIEDLKQLIFDLKNVNPAAAVSVKLVSEAGVGTVAAGVAKAHADRIVIAGDSGGTGASPLSSIKHAGVPWELGLAESHQTLVLNGLRTRVRLETDGQLKTGRDVVFAALLGAEEFGFSTAPLIVEGCIMMRKCHLNTCPVGIATQDPVLRAKFAGSPEHVVNYFFFVAEEARALMAGLGIRRFDDLVGRTDLLQQRMASGKAGLLDLSPLLHRPHAEGSLYCTTSQDHGLDDVSVLDRVLLDRAKPAIEHGEPVRLKVAVRTANRAVGAMLSGEIARRHGHDGLPDDTVRIELSGSAGQSFGAFAVRGVTLALNGEANDYVGKGLSGGRLIITPPRGVRYIPEDTVLIGNTALYGATGGEAFIYGMAGERFAVRNSGAHAVIEGVGDHGCEYMTGGVVVVLGRTGRNFAAGMSGGFAVVFDDDASFAARCNTGLVALERLEDADDRALVRALVERHVAHTNSARGRNLLRRWSAALNRFVKVMPREYKQVLVRRAGEAAANG